MRRGVIPDTRLALPHQDQVIVGDEAQLRRFLGFRFYEDEGPVERAPARDVVQIIIFFVDQDILVLGLAQHVAPDLVRSMRLIFNNIVKGGLVLPRDAAHRLFYRFVGLGPIEILHDNIIGLVARAVDGVGNLRAVRRGLDLIDHALFWVR